MRLRRLTPPLLLAALAGPVWSQSPDVLIQEDDPVIGAGLLSSVQNLTINNAGDWLVLADTDAPTVRDFVVLRQGFPAIREDDPVASPQGASISSLMNSTWRFDDDGNILWNIRIKGAGVTAQNDGSLYWNTRILAQERELVNAPQVSPDTVYRNFLSYDFLTPNRVVIACELDDPEINSPIDDALVQIDFNDFGIVQATNVLIIEGRAFPTDLFPDDGSSAPQIFDRHPNATSFRFFEGNKRGEFIWSPVLANGQQLMMIGLDRVIAAEGDVFESEVDPTLDGRTLDNFNNFEASINDFGDYTFTAGLNGPANTPLADSNAILILNGEKYIQESNALPSWNGATMGNQTQSAFLITNSGVLYWTADLRNTLSSEDQAYMRNDQVIVRKGQTFIDDVLVSDIRTTSDAFEASRDGRFFICEVVLQGGIETAVLYDFGLVLPIPGCNPNPGTVAVTSGTANIGNQFTLEFDDGQEPGVTTLFFLTRNPVLNANGCGANTMFGELFVAPPFPFFAIGPPWVGDPVSLPANIPNRVELVDSTWYAQGMFLDLGMQLPGDDVRLTNGLKLEIGAP